MITYIRFVLLFTVSWVAGSYGQVAPQGDSIGVYAELSYVKERLFFQDFYFIAADDRQVNLAVQCYWKEADTVTTDSILIYRYQMNDISLTAGACRVTVPLKDGSRLYWHPAVAGIMRAVGSYPVGSYTSYVALRDGDQVVRATFHQVVDSNINNRPVSGSSLAACVTSSSEHFMSSGKSSTDVAATLFRARFRLARCLKKRGVTQRRVEDGGFIYFDFYRNGWYLGRYRFNKQVDLASQLPSVAGALDGGRHRVRQTLGSYTSMLSRFRKMRAEAAATAEITGYLQLSANFSNEREPFSDLDNNFYDVNGSVSLPLFGIPVTVSGYYTTQDRHRLAKASFVHLRYDQAKAKEQLLKLIGEFNRGYVTSLSSGQNLQMVYGNYLNQLEQQKEAILAAWDTKLLGGMSDLPDGISTVMENKEVWLANAQSKILDSLQHSPIADSVTNRAQATIDEARDAKELALKRYEEAREYYQKLKALETKLTRYRRMLTQSKQAIYFDSVFAYKQLRDLQDVDNMTYKDLAKKARNILPEGKLKRAVTGLVSFDAGIFSKYVSEYTMGGQNLKGIDGSYDVGIGEVGFHYGQTEYAGAGGGVETYKTYGGRLLLKPVLHQRFGVIYYAYSPARKLLQEDAFFKSSEVSLPSFRHPVQIISGTYEGRLTKYVLINGEYAFSNAGASGSPERSDNSILARSSYRINLVGQIPNTGIGVDAGYEKAGKQFTNNTLPLSPAGIERLSLKGSALLFRAFLRLAVSYDLLLQHNFSARAAQSKWGFELQTFSKRFPNVFFSYKPFATFRTYDDTLQIARKPLLGEVWMGRLQYRYRRPGRSVRLALLYNENKSIQDSATYSSRQLQASAQYNRGTFLIHLTLGLLRIHSPYLTSVNPESVSSRFANLAVGMPLGTRITCRGGINISYSRGGFQRWGSMLGSHYSFKKIPFTAGVNLQYNSLRTRPDLPWKSLVAGSVTVAWHFRFKTSDS